MAYVDRSRTLWAVVLAGLFVICASSGVARAASADEQIASSTQKIVTEDLANANFGEARRKLRSLTERCKRVDCTPSTAARIHIALGMIAAQLNQTDEAKTAFTEALTLDPSAQLPSTGTTPAMRTQFAEAQRNAASAGWENKTAYELAQAAITAEASGKYDECIEKDRQSLKIEDQPRTRLHLATCLAKASQVLDAVRETQKVLEQSIEKKDATLIASARTKAMELLPRIAKVTFLPPNGVSDLVVTFDERPVPQDQLGKKFNVDPGKHKVHAQGVVNGLLMSFDETYDLRDGETRTVQITLKTMAPEYLTRGQLGCMLAAKSQEEVQQCIGQASKPLVVRGAIELSGYTDTTDVHVVTPGLNASVTSPTQGWNVGGNYMLDIVTAASPDIVSNASRAFHEKRHAGGITGGYKPGLYGGQASGSISIEPDYVSRTVGAAFTADILDKMVTPRLSVSHTWDTIGRTPLSFDTYSKSFTVEEISPQVTMVMGPTSVLVLGATIQIERGDQSKPYRTIPMFDQTVSIPRGASITQVNAERLPVKPLEQLPTERERYALAARYNRRMGNATLRVEERLYYDTWTMKASSTDARYLMDLNRMIRVWPHLRIHGQTAANFYQRVPRATLNADGSMELPAYRTTDRELSTLLTLTVGGGTRFTLSKEEAKFQYGVAVHGDAMYTRYFSSLYLTQRLAFYGAVSFDVEFQ